MKRWVCHLLSKRSKEAEFGDADSGSGHFKSEIHAHTLVEILDRLKLECLETQVGAVSTELGFKTLALGEVTQERI